MGRRQIEKSSPAQTPSSEGRAAPFDAGREGSLELVDATEQRLEAGPEEVGHERVVEVEWAIDRAPAAAER